MFDLSEKNNKLQIFEKIKIMNGLIVSDMMRPILEEVGFIFPPLL